jgi:ubiquinone biosynthesis protein UbiJ
MATSSPFPFLDGLLQRAGESLQPPAWMVEEIQRRIVLALNHVLMQEPEAQKRLVKQTGRVVEARWRVFHMRVAATPAGLLELATPNAAANLTLTVAEESPWELFQAALRGERPTVRIDGDVELAGEVNWLVDNVRWDVEEDLSRIVGDAPAHAMGEGGRRMVEALRSFVRKAAPPAASSPPSPFPTSPPGTGA